MLALRDLFRQKAVPVARSRWALHVFWLHAAAFEVFELADVVVSEHILGNAAVSEVPGHRLYSHGVDARPAVEGLTVGLGTRITVLADLFLLEVADIAGGFEERAGVARDIRED
jgi:hypothetical protein